MLSSYINLYEKAGSIYLYIVTGKTLKYPALSHIPKCSNVFVNSPNASGQANPEREEHRMN